MFAMLASMPLRWCEVTRILADGRRQTAHAQAAGQICLSRRRFILRQHCQRARREAAAVRPGHYAGSPTAVSRSSPGCHEVGQQGSSETVSEAISLETTLRIPKSSQPLGRTPDQPRSERTDSSCSSKSPWQSTVLYRAPNLAF